MFMASPQGLNGRHLERTIGTGKATFSQPCLEQDSSLNVPDAPAGTAQFRGRGPPGQPDPCGRIDEPDRERAQPPDAPAGAAPGLPFAAAAGTRGAADPGRTAPAGAGRAASGCDWPGFPALCRTTRPGADGECGAI